MSSNRKHYSESVTGKTELIKRINNQQWEAATLRVKTHPHEASVWYVICLHLSSAIYIGY